MIAALSLRRSAFALLTLAVSLSTIIGGSPFALPQPKGSPSATAESRPWYTVRVEALRCCDDNGGRECAISVKDVRKMIDLANTIYAKARVHFVWSPTKDSALLKNTVINSLVPRGSNTPKDERAPGAGTIEQGDRECYKIAARYPGKMVVFFRWGDSSRHPTGNGYSSAHASWVVMPSPSATNMGYRGFSHEAGHYFGLEHTFARQFKSVAEASEFLENHGGDTSVFDGDRLSDTLPDPGLDIAFRNGVRKVTLDGKKIPIPTGNIMSYMNWDGHEWMSTQQAARVRAFYRFRSRFSMVLPMNSNASSPIEAESLAFQTRGDLSAAPQEMAGVVLDGWSGDMQILGQGHVGGLLALKFEVHEAGLKDVKVYMAFAPDYGKVAISIDENRVGQTFDGYAPLVTPSGPVPLGRLKLSQGTHTIDFTIVGKNDESKGESLGVDCLSLVAVKP